MLRYMSNRYTTTTHKNCKEETLYICILAGGVGFREKNQGVKILHHVGDDTVLQLQLKTIHHTYPKAKVICTVGFQADRVIRARPDDLMIIENQLYEKENIAEEIRLILNAVNPSRLLLVDGAVYFDPEVLRKITENTSIHSFHSDNDQELGFQSENGLVVHMGYGLTEKWSGIVYLEDKAIDILKRSVIRENSKLCLHEVINVMIDKGSKIGITNSSGRIIKF